ncbi:MAG: caspase family protein [Candidatus Acidiferrales bacterium]
MSRGAEPVSSEPNPESPQLTGGTNYALLIATNNYDSKTWPTLANPIFDAKTLQSDLRGLYGFQTELLENPTKRELMEALRKYRNMKFSPNDQLMIFIAGHGKYDEETDEGFLVAKDSLGDDPDEASYIGLATVRDIVEKTPVNHILLVLDSCFSGTFDQKISQAGSRGGADVYTEISSIELRERLLKHKSRLYLTSGGKEYVPDGHPGQHSPFTRKLLECLRVHGDRGTYITFETLKESLAVVTPEPRAGEFGSNDSGGNFMLIAKQ